MEFTNLPEDVGAGLVGRAYREGYTLDPEEAVSGVKKWKSEEKKPAAEEPAAKKDPAVEKEPATTATDGDG